MAQAKFALLCLVLSVGLAMRQQWCRCSSSCEDSAAARRVIEVLPEREYFYVGGHYVDDGTGTGQHTFTGQMYVEHLRSSVVRHPYPLVFIHGAGQTGTNWLNTPDGREGWASWFLKQGYDVFIVDQPFRGRSAILAQNLRNDTFVTYAAEFLERYFTATERFNVWPQAALHTQWPGTGLMGDPVFDAFYASQVPSIRSAPTQQSAMQLAGAALLDRIGPAVLIAHSQAGTYPWAIADVRRPLVKGIVALEPSGPPFQDSIIDANPGRAWGLTDIPVTYSPPIASAAEIRTRTVAAPSVANRSACTLQAEPARLLRNLRDMPILVGTAEASFHAVYDHCDVAYLRQAGALHVRHLRLEDVGIRGNGHMLFMEKNNLQIAAVVEEWIRAIM